MNPTVTGMITVYNDRSRIGRCVESLLNQTYGDLEVLVIDDGSDDGTAETLDRISDSRLRVLHVGRMGRAAALACAAEEARGEFIANLDADDEAHPERIQRQIDFLERHPDHVWVGGGEERIDAQRDEQYLRMYPESDSEIRKMSVKCIPYCHSAITFRRTLVERGLNYDPSQPFLIDFEFFLRVALCGKVSNLPVSTVKRHTHHESYFQRTFSTREQNRELLRLSRKARRQFGLPWWMDIYPAVRAGYPVLPNVVKAHIRRLAGLREHGR